MVLENYVLDRVEASFWNVKLVAVNFCSWSRSRACKEVGSHRCHLPWGRYEANMKSTSEVVFSIFLLVYYVLCTAETWPSVIIELIYSTNASLI